MKTVSNKQELIDSMWFNHLRFYRYKSKTFIKKTSNELKDDLFVCNQLMKEHIKINNEYLEGLKKYKLGLIGEYDDKHIYNERAEKGHNIRFIWEMKNLKLNKEKIKTALAA